MFNFYKNEPKKFLQIANRRFSNLIVQLRIKYRTSKFKILNKIGYYYSLKSCGIVRVVQRVVMTGAGSVELGNNVSLGVYPSPSAFSGEFYIEARAQSSKVIIKDNVSINNNASIIADKSSITIGSRTLIGSNFTCLDSNFHALDPSCRTSNNYKCYDVVIGENVFIGNNVTILRGVNIGNNSVIGAGCVISFDVENDTIVSIDDCFKRAKFRLNEL